MTNEMVLDNAQSILLNGGEVEDVLRYLRSEGITQGQSAVFLVEQAGFDVEVAAHTVRCSPAWADRRAMNDELSRAVFSAVRRFGRLQPDGSYDMTSFIQSSGDEQED
jgi:hypothetical protein